MPSAVIRTLLTRSIRPISTLHRTTTPRVAPKLNTAVFTQQTRTAVTSDSGAFLPDPERINFGLPGVTLTVTIGLFLGAAISKNIAAFLEENELFVPSDDDDDD